MKTHSPKRSLGLPYISHRPTADWLLDLLEEDDQEPVMKGFPRFDDDDGIN